MTATNFNRRFKIMMAGVDKDEDGRWRVFFCRWGKDGSRDAAARFNRRYEAMAAADGFNRRFEETYRRRRVETKAARERASV